MCLIVKTYTGDDLGEGSDGGEMPWLVQGFENSRRWIVGREEVPIQIRTMELSSCSSVSMTSYREIMKIEGS